MNYAPYNFSQINERAGRINPSNIKSYANASYALWERSLYQRAQSVFEIKVPDEWEGRVKDFFWYCLFHEGVVLVTYSSKRGYFFQPCNLRGQDLYYQPTNALISNPALDPNEKDDFEIGKDCEIIRLAPDYCGAWDVISYYAEKLSTMDPAINMAIINSKLAWVAGAKNKAAAESMKKIFDKINKGEPAVFFDRPLMDDNKAGTEPWQFLERKSVKESYITTDLLKDFQTIINQFDSEIGINTIPYEKKERMVTSEAESKENDSKARAKIWLETMQSDIKRVNKLYPDLNLSVDFRDKESEMEVPEDGEDNTNRNV